MMLALFPKSWKASGSTHLPSQVFPQCRSCFPFSQHRPPFSFQLAHVPMKFYSTPASQRPDQAILYNFKRIAALRQDLERLDGVDLLYHQVRYVANYAAKKHREGIDVKDIWINTRKAVDLESQYRKIVSEMCEKEDIEKRKAIAELGDDTSKMKAALLRHHSKLLLFYHELLPIILRFEALLEADAAQQRRLLNSKERRAVRDVLKEYLKSERRSERKGLILTFALISLTGWGYYHWPVKWHWSSHGRSSPGREGDFSELHQRDEDVN